MPQGDEALKVMDKTPGLLYFNFSNHISHFAAAVFTQVTARDSGPARPDPGWAGSRRAYVLARPFGSPRRPSRVPSVDRVILELFRNLRWSAPKKLQVTPRDVSLIIPWPLTDVGTVVRSPSARRRLRRAIHLQGTSRSASSPAHPQGLPAPCLVIRVRRRGWSRHQFIPIRSLEAIPDNRGDRHNGSYRFRCVRLRNPRA